MDNFSYIKFYNDQVTSGQIGYGLPVFVGVRTQRGHGFFGRIFPSIFRGAVNFFKGLALPAAKRALPSAIGLAQDIIAGENVGQSAKTRLIEAGKNVADETLDQLKSKIQKGKGIRRKPLKRLHKNYIFARDFHFAKRRKIVKKNKRKVNKRAKKRKH